MISEQYLELLKAVSSSAPVAGFTHNFYRYPARFSPQFARAVIAQFSLPGEMILDPFMGSGTTIVEALSMDRFAIGIDINPLAHFVASVKTRPLSKNDRESIRLWLNSLQLNRSRHGARFRAPVVNLPEPIHQVLERIILNIEKLPLDRQQGFVRCALLKTGQWAVDCRDELPSAPQVIKKFRINIIDMLAGLDEFVSECRRWGVPKNKITGRRKLFCRSVVGIEVDSYFKSTRQPRLVLTSPPYPGVHVLYHRWQVKGRRETPAPYWLAALNDGHGEAYYSFGSRSRLGVENYFSTLGNAFRSIRKIIHPDALIVQLIAFTDAELQLPLYLNQMREAGYVETNLWATEGQARIWRTVPNRKWYSRLLEEHDAAKEVLLLHRLR